MAEPSTVAVSCDAFLLARSWRDTRSGLCLELWGHSQNGAICIQISSQRAVFFLQRSVEFEAPKRSEVQLRSLEGELVDALYYSSQRELVAARETLIDLGQEPLEADVKPVERFLMERFILGAFRVNGVGRLREGVLFLDNPTLAPSDFSPQLVALSIDIETDGLEGELFSIAGAMGEQQRVFLVGMPANGQMGVRHAWVRHYPDAAAALNAFFDWLAVLDPDLILGWNVVAFDLAYLANLCRRLGIRFRMGRAGRTAEVLEPRTAQQVAVARVPGRVVLDGIQTLRSATMSFESFALGDVAHELLGRRKKIATQSDPVDEIRRMAQQDRQALAEYNLEDCRLVLDIFREAKLIEFAIERQRLTGLAMDRQGGAVAAFDQLYLPRLHRAGYVAPSVGHKPLTTSSPGGYVMDSQPGLYRNVLLLDFKSLYPSIIRTFCIDPLGLHLAGDNAIEGFDGGRFASEGHILPGLIETLWQARDRAKLQKNASLSQVIKILMNSFYGVLGTAGCRFHDTRLVSSITRRGHEILGRCRSFIQEQGLEVIYGDTDSVFVSLGADLSEAQCRVAGQTLARELTSHFAQELQESAGIESHLELEFETHFLRFLMPTMRGSELGTKKRYAGLIRLPSGDNSLVIKGLEAVRTDWTELARQFQRRLLQRVFEEQPYQQYVRAVSEQLLAGKLDEQLIYRRRLRRPLTEYLHNVPPHVQAARQLPNPGRSIQYVITIAGPQPVARQTAVLDYQHYLERQLAPAADSLLHFLGTSFAQLAGPQLSLF